MPFLQIRSYNLRATDPVADAPSADPPRIVLSCGVAGESQAAASACLGITRTEAPAVGYVTEEPGGRLRVTGWLPRRQFRRLSRALSRGGPLRLVFDLRDPGARVGYLLRIGLTGPEGILAMASAVPVPVLAGARRVPVSRFAMPH